MPSRESSVPDAWYSTSTSAAALSAASIIVTSTRLPSPVRSRSRRARMVANTAWAAASGSHAPRCSTGGPSAQPVTHAMPVIDSIVCAKPVRSRHGPSSPYAGMRVITRRGFTACSTS